MVWQLSGEYFETCNCDVLCPCIYTGATARPTQGHCDAILAFRADSGTADGVDLAGLKAVIALQTPGPMSEGGGRRAVYVDAEATERQRQALGAIFGGEAGGAPAALVGIVPELLGIHSARIGFTIDGDSRGLTIEGVGEMSVTGIPGVGGPLTLTHSGHPVNSTLALARAGTTASFKGAGFDFDNAGKNGHFAPFSWQG